VGIVCVVNVLRANLVAPTVACIGTLIVPDRSTIGATAANTIGTALFHLAGAEALLTWKGVGLGVTIRTIKISSLG
jgi:hypothetical protein